MTIRNYLLSGLLLVLGYCLTACSEENYIPGEEAQGQPVSMQLQIGMASGEPLGPLTRAAGEIDTEPQDGELIHSLKVFITSTDNRVEQVVPFTFTSEQETEMVAGNLSECTSDPFTILTGSKIIYAFANYEGLLDDYIENVSEGDVLDLPPTITWDGGASWKPDAENEQFIPMSVKQPVTISDHSNQVSVELVRLLSKLYVSFHNTTSEAVTVSDWSVGKFNTTINLFRGDEIAALSSTPWSVPASTTESFTVSTSDDNTEPYLFYVSESAMSGGFEIYVTQGSEQEKTRHTNRTEIPRNRIWPLAIYFSDFSLKMTIEYRNPPIGGYPPETVESDLSGDVTYAIKGGGPFILTPTLESTSSEAVPSQVTWNIVIGEENNNSLLVKDLNVEGNTITGVMEGAAEQEESYTFTLQALNGDRVIAEFQVTLTFKDIFEN